MIVCVLEYEYELYSRLKLDIKDENEIILNFEEVVFLEEYIFIWYISVIFFKCICIIFMVEFNLLDYLLFVIMGEKNLSNFMNIINF